MPWWTIIGFLILLVLGAFLTLYYLKPGWFDEPEGFQSSTPQPQVYLITNANGSAMSYLQANAACTIMGGRLALATEVYNAAVGGLRPNNTPGWIAEDQEYGYCPVPKGQSLSGANGPAIVRFGAEIDTDCNGNYRATAPNAALCYGLLPAEAGPTTDAIYKIYVTGRSFKALPNNNLLNTTNLSSVFDRVISGGTSQSSYTILDLDALNIQKSIIIIDMENKNKTIYDSEKALTQKLTENKNILSILDTQEQRIQIGYVLASQHLNILKNISNFYSSINFATDPFYLLIYAFAYIIDFNRYRNVLLSNINYYYSDIISKLNLHPVGYINSGVLNMPNYVNSAGLIPLKDANTWEYKMEGAKIKKRRTPPYPGCGTITYKNSISPQTNGVNDNWLSFMYHCPGGNWWQDIQRKTWIWETCPPGYTKPPFGGSTNCYLEYPQLEKEITVRDNSLTQISSIQTVAYPTTFLSGSDGWVPVRNSEDSKLLLDKFIADKTAAASGFAIALDNTYRWKAVNYFGTLSPKNIAEVKQSALISAFFNFTDTGSIEKQIRIASYPPFNLHYSKLVNAKPEYVQIMNQASRAPSSNAELFTALTLLGVVTSVIGGVLSIRSIFTGRGAGIAATASLAGGAISIGAGAATTSQGAQIDANLKIAASNADYNSGVCTAFDLNTFSLLPYQTRQFISIWATMRKQRIIEWYANSVISQSPASKNPPEGPYKDSPKAAAEAARLGRGSGTLSTVIDRQTIYDIPANIFGAGSAYTLSESSTINSLGTIAARKAVYDAMAQTYYEKNGGVAYITKIIDVYQVGTTLYDVRFTESRRSGSQTFLNKITALNTQYKQYRYMNLSDQQLNNLETAYSSTIEKLYDDENRNLKDSAIKCGVNAQFIKITRTGSQPFNFAQVIVINNFGQNVALFKRPTASSTFLAGYENKTGQTYYDSNYNEYDVSNCKIMAARDNSGTILTKLSGLTDGTYIPRYDSFYRSENTATDATLMIDFGKSFDISLVKILYNPVINGGTFRVELLNKEKEVISASPYTLAANKSKNYTNVITCNSTGSTTLYFLLAGRKEDDPPCPTDIYSQYKIGRFFAVDPPAPPVVAASDAAYDAAQLTYARALGRFTAYADGPHAATTFNPLYNSGFSIDITDSYGNVDYVPVTVFNIVPTITMPDCSDLQRIKTIFKDHLLFANSTDFKNRPDINGLVNKYDSDYLYKPAIVTAAANASADKYKCAYVWKENVYDASNGSIIPDRQVERYGIFNYQYDTENWVSRGIVFDSSNSVQFSTRSGLTAALGTATLSTISTSLYMPYWDSLKLYTDGGRCSETDCADPDVINSIMTEYNSIYESVLPNSKVLRVTKALTVAPNKCEYEFLTLNSLKSNMSIEVRANAECKYEPTDFTLDGIRRPTRSTPLYLTDDTPLLAKAYNYASDSIKPFVDTMTSIYSDLYDTYLLPQIDAAGDGIKGDIIKYRNTTNTAAGVIRNVSVIGQPVVNEAGVECTTQCNSPEIIQSFFAYYNNTGGDKVTGIRNAGMDASGNCDFTYETQPVLIGTSGPVLGSAMTRAAKFRIARYLNSCAYRVDGEPAVIMPTPDFSSIMTFNPIDVFGSASGRPSGQPINTAQLGITGQSGVRIIAAGSPFVQTASIIENVDYINCLSKYALASISTLGVVGYVSGVGQVDAKTCAINLGGVQKQYAFVPQTSVVAGMLAANRETPVVRAATLSPITASPLSTYGSLPSNPAVNCSDPATMALTGFAPNTIVASETIASDTCEYKITRNNSLPFANTFQRVSFYTDNGLHLKSMASSNPLTSPYAYFKTATSSFITDYMNLLQFARYSWNANFYSARPKNTIYWKIGNITKIGILADDDAIVFEAESSKFGAYGSLDIRAYATKRYFKFTPRIATNNGIDPNTTKPYTINNITIYKSEDNETPFGEYRVSGVPSSDQYTQICTYNGINYNTAWYDLNNTTIGATKPSTAPPSVFVVQTMEAPLTRGIYNRVRFTVNAAGLEGRAEIARIMFYDLSGTSTYIYQPVPNAIVGIQDISSNYLLGQSGKAKCDTNYRAIVDPETTMAECVYVGNGSREYTQSTPCNNGDTTISVVGQQYKCLNITPITYTKPANVACGIGYFGLDTATTCTLVGDFQEVSRDPAFMFNLNQYIPRLRLPLNKSMTILFNKTIYIAGFSFITGSAGTLPLQWTLEGSINGITWRTIHCQSVPYVYTGARVPTGSTTSVLSFFTPGIFPVNRTGSSGGTCSIPAAATGPMNSAGYSSNNLTAYNTMAGNIAEGFKSGSAPNIDSIFTVPLKQEALPSLRPVNSLASANQIQILKFKILETYDPESKFVHMSSLEFLTRSGKAQAIKLSNLHGSRSSSKEGVAALLEDPQRRWVDYNKSEILIQFAGPPITGFRFSIPQGIPNAAAAMPIQWIMYGSHDRKNWITLHEFNGDSLPMINSVATQVFKFSNEI